MRARLYVLGGRDVGRSFDLEDGAVLGRGEDCAIRLRDLSISRRHARVVCEGERWFLEDLESRNGIRRGGERVRRAELADHDEVLLGELPLRIRLEEPGAPLPALERAPEPAEILLEEEGAPDPAAGTHEALRPAPLVKPAPLAEPALRRRALVGEARRGGRFSADLAQLPAWKRGLYVALVLLLSVGLGWLAFLAVRRLRGSW